MIHKIRSGLGGLIERDFFKYELEQDNDLKIAYQNWTLSALDSGRFSDRW